MRAARATTRARCTLLSTTKCISPSACSSLPLLPNKSRTILGLPSSARLAEAAAVVASKFTPVAHLGGLARHCFATLLDKPAVAPVDAHVRYGCDFLPSRVRVMRARLNLAR